jgi:hypothetical protein
MSYLLSATKRTPVPLPSLRVSQFLWRWKSSELAETLAYLEKPARALFLHNEIGSFLQVHLPVQLLPIRWVVSTRAFKLTLIYSQFAHFGV